MAYIYHTLHDFIRRDDLKQFYSETPITKTKDFCKVSEFNTIMTNAALNNKWIAPIYTKFNSVHNNNYVAIHDMIYDWTSLMTSKSITYECCLCSDYTDMNTGMFYNFSKINANVFLNYAMVFGVVVGGGGGGASDGYKSGNPGSGGNPGHASLIRFHTFLKSIDNDIFLSVMAGKGGNGNGGTGSDCKLIFETYSKITLNDGTKINNVKYPDVITKGGKGGGIYSSLNNAQNAWNAYINDVNAISPNSITAISMGDYKSFPYLENYGKESKMHAFTGGIGSWRITQETGLKSHPYKVYDYADMFTYDAMYKLFSVDEEVLLGKFHGNQNSWFYFPLGGMGGANAYNNLDDTPPDIGSINAAYSGDYKKYENLSTTSQLKSGAGGFGSNNSTNNNGRAGNQYNANTIVDYNSTIFLQKINTIGRGGGGAAFSSRHVGKGGDGGNGGVVLFSIPNFLDYLIYEGLADPNIYNNP